VHDEPARPGRRERRNAPPVRVSATRSQRMSLSQSRGAEIHWEVRIAIEARRTRSYSPRSGGSRSMLAAGRSSPSLTDQEIADAAHKLLKIRDV